LHFGARRDVEFTDGRDADAATLRPARSAR
jgi:hypothetical protein